MLERVNDDLQVLYDRISGAGVPCSVHLDTVTDVKGDPFVTIQYAYSDIAEDVNRTRVESVNRYRIMIASPPAATDGVPDFGTAFNSSMGLAITISNLFLRKADARKKDGSITVTRVDQEPINRNGLLISGVVIEVIFRYPVRELL